MLLLIVGVALWWAAHMFKRAAPAQRAAMGDSGKGMLALALGLSIVLMVIGYRGTAIMPVWTPAAFVVHINNLLILIAIYMMSPAPKRGAILNRMRHPMLAGFALWAFAHLLANGEVADLILFGGLLAWVPVQIAAINRAVPDWAPHPRGKLSFDGMFLAGSAILLVVIGYIHAWLGPWPFAT